jgi:hypothetical protein
MMSKTFTSSIFVQANAMQVADDKDEDNQHEDDGMKSMTYLHSLMMSRTLISCMLRMMRGRLQMTKMTTISMRMME